MPIWQLCANLLIPNCLRSNLSYSPLAALELYVKSLNSICFLENILIFRYVPDDEAKKIIYMEREAKTYRKIDKDRAFPLCPLPLMPEEVLRIMTIRALKLFRNDTNIWFDVENQRITLSKGLDNSYLYFNERMCY